MSRPSPSLVRRASALWLLAGALTLVGACDGDDEGGIGGPGGELPAPGDATSLTDLPYAPEVYELPIPAYFPRMAQPDSNRATVAGVALGRMLFFDPILSRDSTFSCANCHQPERAFADGEALSRGIDGLTTARSSMSLMNVGYQKTLFWDGRAASLEEQSLHPIEDEIEFAAEWGEIEERLRRSPDYRRAFRAAFGLESSAEIDRYHAAKAIAQFERTLISATSRFDAVVFGLDGFFTDAEERGRELYFSEPGFEHPGCAHCHNQPLFGESRFTNNGLQAAGEDLVFGDPGRGAVVGDRQLNGFFKAPSLRNIELTAPYMHDGRLATLDDVLDHYSSRGHYSPTRDNNIMGFPLDERQREDLKAFLRTLTDTAALAREEYQAPER